MQIINKTVQCPECGCIAFPDAICCPKCGTSYRANKERAQIKDILETIDCFSMQEPLDIRPSIMKACKLICPHHGQVDIRATVVIPVVKCPLYQGTEAEPKERLRITSNR